MLCRAAAASLVIAAFAYVNSASATCLPSGRPPCTPCTTPVCYGDGWECDPVLDGKVCDDGNACTTGDHCEGGVCRGGDPVVCQPLPYDPTGQCNVLSCNTTSGGCTATPKTNDPCNDNSNGTYSDHCDAGGHCVGTTVTCLASNTCVTYTPVGTPTCQVSYAGTTVTCSDSSVCTGT